MQQHSALSTHSHHIMPLPEGQLWMLQWAAPYYRLHFCPYPCTHFHTDHCSFLTCIWNKYSDHHSKKKKRLLTCKWRFFEMCGPHLYSTPRPPSPLLWIGQFSVEKELKMRSVCPALYRLWWKHKVSQGACADQWTLTFKFSNSGHMAHA